MKLAKLGIITLILLTPLISHAQINGGQLGRFLFTNATGTNATTTNFSTRFASTTDLYVSSAGGTGTRCLQVDGVGKVSVSAGACGTGGFAFPFDPVAGGNATNTLIYFYGGLYATGSSTLQYASTTVTSATTLCLATDCRTTWPAGGSGAYPFSPTTNYGAATNATTGVVWFQNGMQASSTSQIAYASSSAITADSVYIPTQLMVGTSTPGQMVSIHGGIFSNTAWNTGIALPAIVTALGGDSSMFIWNPKKGAILAGERTVNLTTANMGDASTNFGLDNTASGYGSFAVGEGNLVSNDYSGAIGQDNIVAGNSSFSAGELNNIRGAQYSTAIGYQNETGGDSGTGDEAVALGFQNKAFGAYSTAIGGQNTASSTNVGGDTTGSVAIGTTNTVTTANSVAIGDQNSVGGTSDGNTDEFAFGVMNTVDGDGAFSIGRRTTATANGAIIIGSNPINGGLMTNSTAYSVGIGASSTVPTLMVTRSIGAAGTFGNVGIATTSPYRTLSVAGIGVFDDHVDSSYFTATSTASSTLPRVGATGIGTSWLCFTTSCRTSWAWLDSPLVNAVYNTALGSVGVGTTTPKGAQLVVASSTAAQIGISSGGLDPEIKVRLVGNTLYFSTSTPGSNSTTSPPFFEIQIGAGTLPGITIATTTSASTTIREGIIQRQGYNAAGALVCGFIAGTSWVWQLGACNQ